VIRVVVSAIVVFGTYNPTGKSVYHWIAGHPNPTDAWVVLAGIVTALAVFSLLIASWKTFGMLGTTVIAILFAAVVDHAQCLLRFRTGGCDHLAQAHWPSGDRRVRRSSLKVQVSLIFTDTEKESYRSPFFVLQLLRSRSNHARTNA